VVTSNLPQQPQTAQVPAQSRQRRRAQLVGLLKLLPGLGSADHQRMLERLLTGSGAINLRTMQQEARRGRMGGVA
jgi:hypothetical protein